MMALKDWKKTPHTGHLWSRTNKEDRYSIWISYYDLVWNFDNEIGRTHKFKTKSAALKYAKNYMRQH